MIKYLIDNGADINSNKDKRDNSPLIYAIQTLENSEENDDIINYLIDHGADVNEINRQGDTPLIYAIRKGKIEVIKALIKHGADINRKTNFGSTPLITALFEKNDTIVKYLLNHGVDINERSNDNSTPLHYAIDLLIRNENESMAVVDFLLEKGANLKIKNKSGDTPLLLAIKTGNIELIERLLREGAILDPELPPQRDFVKIIDHREIDLVKKFNLYGVDTNLALIYAIEKGDLTIIKLLVEHCGVKINEQEHWNRPLPLRIAIKSGRVDVVKCLLEEGAKVNWHLLYAIKRGNKDIIKCLVDAGANVNYQQNRCSPNPLVKVGEHGNVNILRYVLDHGANLHQLYFHLSKIDGDRTEMMPLLIAILNRKIGIVKYMIDHGANVARVRGYFDNDPIKYAIQSTNLELVQSIVEHGAEVNEGCIEYAIMMGEINIVRYLIQHIKACDNSFYITNKFYNYHDEYYDLNLYYQIKEILDNKRKEIYSIH